MSVLFGPCTSSYKLYILPILYKILQYCFINASIVLSLLSEMPPAAASMPAASMPTASMLPVPLTVLLRHEFAATIHLLRALRPPARGPATAPRAGPRAGSLVLGSSSGEPPAEARVCCSTTHYQQTTATRPTLSTYREPGITNLQCLEKPPADNVCLASTERNHPVEVELYTHCS